MRVVALFTLLLSTFAVAQNTMRLQSDGPTYPNINFVAPGVATLAGNNVLTGTNSFGSTAVSGSNFSITGGSITGLVSFTSFGVNSLSTGTATSGANYASYGYTQQGSYWTGSAAGADIWTIGSFLGSGSNPTSTLAIGHTGTSGALTVSIPYPTTVSTLKVGTGAAFTFMGILSSASYTFSSIGPAGCTDIPFTVTGAAVGAIISGVTAPSTQTTNIILGGVAPVTSANTVTVRFCNESALTTYTPVNGVYKMMVAW